MSTQPVPEGREWALAVGSLLALVLAIYLQTGDHAFINYDTPGYLWNNPQVAGGLTLESVQWAFTSIWMANWHPVTWLSHMLDVQLFGMDPGAHHLVNVLLHAINSVLLLIVMQRYIGRFWPAFFVAALFAVHPTHVQSVAWVAERKDLLSGMFFLLALWAYRSYVADPTLGRRLLVLLCAVLGVMSKSMLVTLPFVLLLLDVWPLGRIEPHRLWQPAAWWPRIREKLDLFVLVFAIAVLALLSQQGGGAMSGSMDLPLSVRIANAIHSYWFYVHKTLVPQELSLYYPHTGQVPIVPLIVASVVVGAGTLASVMQLRARPWLAVGWFWYLGMLVPVIGLVQIGGQAAADRYTYLPTIGLYLVLVLGVLEIAERGVIARRSAVQLGALMVLVYAGLAWQNTGHWKSSVTIWQQTLITQDPQYEVLLGLADGEFGGPKAGGIAEAYLLAGNAFRDEGNLVLALLHYDAGTSIRGDLPGLNHGRAEMMRQLGLLPEPGEATPPIEAPAPD